MSFYYLLIKKRYKMQKHFIPHNIHRKSDVLLSEYNKNLRGLNLGKVKKGERFFQSITDKYTENRNYIKVWHLLCYNISDVIIIQLYCVCFVKFKRKVNEIFLHCKFLKKQCYRFIKTFIFTFY